MQAMKAYGKVGVQLHSFLNSALDGGELSSWWPTRFPFGESDPGIYWIAVWMSPREEKNLLG